MKNQIKSQFLFCPGPVIVAGNVFDAVNSNIGHREEEFSTLLSSINEKLLGLFEIRKKNFYHPLLITGSGTAGNEAVLSSIVGNKHILILANGEFGERLHAISKIHNKNTHILHFGWGKTIDVAKVETYLKKHKVDIIAMVHNETSIGILNPAAEIGELSKKYKKMFYIDAVSSVGADKLDLEAWNVSFCTTTSGKAICSLPGLGIIMTRKRDVEALKNLPPKTAYLNLYNLYKYSAQHVQTPNTPAVHLFYAFEQALTNILDKGVEAWRSEIKRKAKLLRSEIKTMGLTFLIDERLMSSSLTTVRMPEHTTIHALRAKLKEKDIVIYNGKGPFLDQVFQVGNIGQLTDADIKMFLKSLKQALVQVDMTKTQASKKSVKPQVILPRTHLSLQRVGKSVVN